MRKPKRVKRCFLCGKPAKVAGLMPLCKAHGG